MKEAKKWLIRFIVALMAALAAIAIIVIVIDPYLHYHKPLGFISYRYNNERYLNDGIARQYDYETIIIGTSMTQNFKPSEWESLTGQKTIKLPFPGGDFMEMREQMERAFEYNDEIKTIIWGIDYDALVRPYDFHSYENHPTYLYDNNPFNDVKYILNKGIIYQGVMADLERTVSGTASDTLDTYSAWNYEGGLDHIMLNYNRLETAKEMEPDLPKEQEEKLAESFKGEDK